MASVCCACGQQVDEREGYLEYEGHKCCAILYVPSGTNKVKEVYGYVADEDLERYQSGDRDFSIKVLHPFDPDQWSVIDAKTISKITANYCAGL